MNRVTRPLLLRKSYTVNSSFNLNKFALSYRSFHRGSTHTKASVTEYSNMERNVEGGATATTGEEHHHHHEPHYTDNEGRLFNVPSGQQYQFQGWEVGHYLFFIGAILALMIGLTCKPDYSVEAWADEEFLRRKKAREQTARNE
jgi:hypothetical protein